MDRERLFDAMDAAGVGRPKDGNDLGRYGPWQPIYRAYRQGKSEASILGQIPWVAQSMGRNRARTEAVLQAWHQKAAELDAAKRESSAAGSDIVVGMAFGFDSEAGQ